jgi:trimethylamine:corrinoid methyltransferase-like protein
MEVLATMPRTLRGIEVNDETLAVDEIVKVGPIANYLGTPSLRMYRKEHYVPELLEMLGHVECAPVNPV